MNTFEKVLLYLCGLVLGTLVMLPKQELGVFGIGAIVLNVIAFGVIIWNSIEFRDFEELIMVYKMTGYIMETMDRNGQADVLDGTLFTSEQMIANNEGNETDYREYPYWFVNRQGQELGVDGEEGLADLLMGKLN